MLKIIRIILSIMVVAIGIYGIITPNSNALPYEMFFLGIVIVLWSISELRQNRKKVGIIYILVSVLLFYDAIQNILFR
ncbi:DUF3953 domain-containing protein [Neobacillus sp. NRS-1170]|uniref:DUF3953 domain-containing protein n=1 Tax=Neobacillus sp. NRS-1170 TaxID=3233898 RepID=UPI003D2E91BC